MPAAVLFRDEIREYDFGPGHPFRGDRYPEFFKFFHERVPEDDSYRVIEADRATDEDLLLINTQDYIDFTRDYYRAAHEGLSFPGPFYRYQSPDNAVAGKPGKLEEAARLVVGQAKKACGLVQGREFKKAFSIGGGLHHAKPSYGEGFCLYNDVAFAATYLLKEYGLKRVLIIDTDAHAGNGTSQYFYETSEVLLIDMHQDPRSLYPGTGFADQTGSGRGKGFTVNIPMPVHAGDDSYRAVFEELVEPIAGEFRPEAIIRNGGSDPHFRDGLTNLGLTTAGFKMIGERVHRIAELCDGRQIDMIASGYNREVLPYAWLALITGLAAFDLQVEEPGEGWQRSRIDAPLEETRVVIEQVKRHHRQYWRSLE